MFRPQPKKRVLFCFTSVNPAEGGLSAVNRSVTRAVESASWLEARFLVFDETENRSRLRYLFSVLRTLKDWKPDLVWVDHVQLTPVAWLGKLLFQIPYAVFCHGIEFDVGYRWEKHWGFRGAARRFSNSNYTRDRLMGRYPNLPIETVWLGVKPEFKMLPASSGRQKVTDDAGRTVVIGKHAMLIVGRIDYREDYKGHRQLILAVAKLSADFPKIQLLIAGAGNGLAQLKSEVKKMRLECSVVFLGSVDETVLAQCYRACRFYAMPSRGEGFGLVYAEAMAYGKPCVVSTSDAGREIVAEAGLAVNPVDEFALTTSLQELLKSDAKVGKLGRAARKRFEEFFSFAAFTDRFLRSLASSLGVVVEAEKPARKRRRA